MAKHKILFLCTGNSCRSQMAEGWARHLRAQEFEAYSAGTAPQGLNPLAVQVMAEVGVDISGQSSKALSDFEARELDEVVAVCDRALENCPELPVGTRLRRAIFEDPPALAARSGSEREALDCYRRVRDEIGAFVRGFVPAAD